MALDMEKAAADYLSLRDAAQAIMREAETKAAHIERVMEKIANQMLAEMNENNASSIRTSAGTIIRQEDMKPRATDWDAFYTWIGENDAFEFLERRVTKTAVAAYFKEHGEPPPGVSVIRELKVTVRRK
jgi:vacuolar-type H+-ATPase subunit H